MKQLVISKSITSRNSPSLKYYFNELNSIPRLTDNEEYELSVLAYEGDENAREKLVKHNLRFVISVAKQYQIKGVRLDDLINEGNVGLIKASKRFDPSRGFKFISFAVWWIRQTILLYINQNSSVIRKPNNKLNSMLGIKRIISRLEQKLEREPSYDEIHDALKDKYRNDDIEFYIHRYNNNVASLDAPLVVGEAFSLGETIEDVTESKVNLKGYDSKFRCEKMLELVSNEESNILRLIYGLDGPAILSIKEIAEILEMTPSRVRKVKDRALRKLNYRIRKNANWLREMN